MFNFKNLFKKEDWRLIKEIDITYSFTDPGESHGKITYYLYESNKGNRRFEYIDSCPFDKIHPIALRSDSYMKIIYPWLQGRYDPEIPRYDEIPEMNTAAALKGKL